MLLRWKKVYQMEAGKAQDSNLNFYDTISRRGEKKESTAIKQRENSGGAIMERQYDCDR